jgi:hypothetical protein
MMLKLMIIFRGKDMLSAAKPATLSTLNRSLLTALKGITFQTGHRPCNDGLSSNQLHTAFMRHQLMLSNHPRSWGQERLDADVINPTQHFIR